MGPAFRNKDQAKMIREPLWGRYGLIILMVLSLGCMAKSQPNAKKMNTGKQALAEQLKKARFDGLFQYGDHSQDGNVWQDGKNRKALLEIVSDPKQDDYVRLLASEVLYGKDPGYPPRGIEDDLAYIYAKAVEISGSREGALLSGNLWGFMYYSDKDADYHYETLGKHLIHTGKKSVPHLARLLDNGNPIYYEGSEEATIGNGLRYRVKDVAAYYIGKIMGIPVAFHEQWPDRDAEIERLKQKL